MATGSEKIDLQGSGPEVPAAGVDGLPRGRPCLRARTPAILPLTCVLLTARVSPSLVRGLLAVSLAVNALFTSAYLYQSLR